MLDYNKYIEYVDFGKDIEYTASDIMERYRAIRNRMLGQHVAYFSFDEIDDWDKKIVYSITHSCGDSSYIYLPMDYLFLSEEDLDNAIIAECQKILDKMAEQEKEKQKKAEKELELIIKNEKALLRKLLDKYPDLKDEAWATQELPKDS